MKIAIVFDKMIYGGIERVGISHIQLLKELGHTVDAYVLDKHTEPIVKELQDLCDVRIIPLRLKECPETYWTITRRFKLGVYAFPIIRATLSFWIHIKSILYRYRRPSYDVAIGFSGHYNDLSFVAYNFVRSKKKIAWLHGALYQYIMSSQGFETLYKKIKNLVVLVGDGQEEVFAVHKDDGFDFNVTKIYNPIPSTYHLVNRKVADMLKQKYGDYFLMVSRMVYPHKDHYTVIKALSILKDKYNIKKNLVLVGDGPERKKIENYIAELGMGDQVKIEGSKGDVQNYFCSCNILVHASVAGEGLPTVLLEAMEYKKPLVCTDSKVGPREIIGNNEYGLLCQVQDAEEMAECMYKLVDNTETYQKYSEKSYERRSSFTPSSIIAFDKRLLENLR